MNLPMKILALLGFAAFAAGVADAQTLSKLIDKNGKVTYSEKVPDNYDGKVVPVTIDPNANKASLPRPQNPRGDEPAMSPKAESVARARESLEAAKKALQNARDNP